MPDEQTHSMQDYTLEPSEIASFRGLLHFQNSFSFSRQLTNVHIREFFNWMKGLAGYNSPVHIRLKDYYNLVFDPLSNMEQLPTMYQALWYRDYVREIWFDDPLYQDTWYSYWVMYRHGWKWVEKSSSQEMREEPGLVGPNGPESWRSKVEKLLSDWGDHPPASAINVGTKFNEWQPIRESADALLNGWTAFPTVTTLIAPLWDAMKNDLLALQAADAVDNPGFFFLLHLLIGLGAGNEAMADYVYRLTSAKTSTEAYPNETFINQLTYLVLMYVGDPREPDGKYGWNNGQLQALFTEFRNITMSGKPGSEAILKSINLQLRLLNSTSSYPLIDPESSLPLSERKAMTRAALVRVFKSTPFDAHA